MSHEADRIQSTLQRLSLMFRVTVGLVLLGVLSAVIGAIYMFTDSNGALFVAGILFSIVAVLTCYKIVLSTMKLIERAREKGIHLR